MLIRSIFVYIATPCSPCLHAPRPCRPCLPCWPVRGSVLRWGPRKPPLHCRPSWCRPKKSAARQQAYAVVGHIPVALGKIPSAGLQVLLKGDPAMRRVFVVVEPGPLHPASRHARRQAHRLADFLVSPAGQSLLVEIDQARGGPWLFPLPKPERP